MRPASKPCVSQASGGGFGSKLAFLTAQGIRRAASMTNNKHSGVHRFSPGHALLPEFQLVNARWKDGKPCYRQCLSHQGSSLLMTWRGSISRLLLLCGLLLAVSFASRAVSHFNAAPTDRLQQMQRKAPGHGEAALVCCPTPQLSHIA